MKSTPPTPPRGTPPLTPRSTAAQRAPAAPTKPAELERALALRDVMDHAVRVQREITAPKRLRRSRWPAIVTAVLCVALLGLSAYSWIARPELIWGPRLAATPRTEAGVRLAMFLLAQRLEARRAADGSLPASLETIGEAESGIAYRVVSDSAFELSDTVNTRTLTYRSTESPDAFLGNSLAALAGGAKAP